MSIHIEALRDIAANHGWPVCDEAADEIQDLERAYALLFAENAKLRANEELLEAVDAMLECAPCDCSDKRRYEQGEHLSSCYLFDLNIARSRMLAPPQSADDQTHE